MNLKDNCATVLDDIQQNEALKINQDLIILAKEKIPFGHKIALKEIKKDNYVYKYGEIIGKASENIELGDWIHTHNIKSAYLERANDD